MPRDHRTHQHDTTPEPPDQPDPDATPCPGQCNAAWRAAERRRLAKATPNELQPRPGEPVWCPACTTSIRGTLTDWPTLATALAEEIVSGVSAGLGEYVSGSKEQPVHDHEAPSMLLDEVAEYLAAWENTIRTGRTLAGRRWTAEHGDGGRDPHRDPVATITAVVAFLPAHLGWVLGDRPTGEEAVAEDFGQMLLDYHRRAQHLTGTGQPEPVRVLGVACPSCDRCALEYEVEPAANRRGRLQSFVYDENGDVRLMHPFRPQWPVRGPAQKLTETTTKPLEGAITGYIACRRCKPTFRMAPDEYQRWLKQLAHDACTRGMATRAKLSIVFGGDIPTEYAKALPAPGPRPDTDDLPSLDALGLPRPAATSTNQFDPHAFTTGQIIRVKPPGPDPTAVERVIRSVDISPDGSTVELTFEEGPQQ
jgi:hypothetical protein